MASRADLLIYQGDDYAAIVLVTANGTPTPPPPDQIIAGYSAKAQIREAVADAAPDVVVEMATIVESPYIRLSIPAIQTVNLCNGYVWDLQVTSPEGGITTLLQGAVRVTQEVTR